MIRVYRSQSDTLYTLYVYVREASELTRNTRNIHVHIYTGKHDPAYGIGPARGSSACNLVNYLVDSLLHVYRLSRGRQPT